MDAEFRRLKCGALSWLECGAGTPLVMLHGVASSALSWERPAARLLGRFRVIAPDLVGFGESGPTAGGFSMEEQARAIAKLLDLPGQHNSAFALPGCGQGAGHRFRQPGSATPVAGQRLTRHAPRPDFADLRAARRQATDRKDTR